MRGGRLGVAENSLFCILRPTLMWCVTLSAGIFSFLLRVWGQCQPFFTPNGLTLEYGEITVWYTGIVPLHGTSAPTEWINFQLLMLWSWFSNGFAWRSRGHLSNNADNGGRAGSMAIVRRASLTWLRNPCRSTCFFTKTNPRRVGSRYVATKCSMVRLLQYLSVNAARNSFFMRPIASLSKRCGCQAS